MNLLTLNTEHKQHLPRCTLLGVSSQKFSVIAEKYGATCKPDGVILENYYCISSFSLGFQVFIVNKKQNLECIFGFTSLPSVNSGTINE